MDTYAIQAAIHMKTPRHDAAPARASAAAQNHGYGARNPLAQYRFEMSVDEVIADREVTYPFTRAMCAPIGDGAASAIVCSADCPGRIAVGRAGPRRQDPGDASSPVAAIAPSTSPRCRRSPPTMPTSGPASDPGRRRHRGARRHLVLEIYQLEMLRIAEPGEGGPMVESGATGPGGTVPVNTSGGLVSKGHPVGATGLSMVHELVLQLRGEAGDRQVPGARIALQENGGGVIGLEEAACSVMLLERGA